MTDRIAAVFGGTGFLGRRIVRRLRDRGLTVRVASRRPSRYGHRAAADDKVVPVAADIHDSDLIAAACAGAHAVVNAVSLYVEHGRATFHSIHVQGAERLALEARRAGAQRLVHVSGLGADPTSASAYIASRGTGEIAVSAAFPGATVVRPAVMFGPGDSFLTAIVDLLRRLPAYPMFGQGRTRLQPVFVEDVAEAVARIVVGEGAHTAIWEFGGPAVLSYEELLRLIARHANLRTTLVPLPFGAWHALAYAAEWLPRPPLTRNQVELMEIDTVVAAGMPGLGELGISPQAIEQILPQILKTH